MKTQNRIEKILCQLSIVYYGLDFAIFLYLIQHFDFMEVNTYSYEQLFQTMRILRFSYPEAEQLFRRMVFNVLARNCDDHTKNFAFTMNQDGQWNLSPAYDICYAYRPGSPWVSRQSLSVNGQRDQISHQDLLALAKSMNIKKPEQIIDVVKTQVKRWEYFAEEQQVPSSLLKAIQSTLLLH